MGNHDGTDTIESRTIPDMKTDRLFIFAVESGRIFLRKLPAHLSIHFKAPSMELSRHMHLIFASWALENLLNFPCILRISHPVLERGVNYYY